MPPASYWDDNMRAFPKVFASLVGAGHGSFLTGTYRVAHIFGAAAIAAGVVGTLGMAIVGIVRGGRTPPALVGKSHRLGLTMFS